MESISLRNFLSDAVLPDFLQIFQIFFKYLLSLDKVPVEVRPNFYFWLFKNFPASFRTVFKFLF